MLGDKEINCNRIVCKRIDSKPILFFSFFMFYSLVRWAQKSDADTGIDGAKEQLKTPRETKRYVTSSAPQTMPGHTGYLTFATLPPLFAR